MSSHNSKKGPAGVTQQKAQDEPNDDPSTTSTPSNTWGLLHLSPVIRAWLFLFAHGGVCIALAMSMFFGLDGYQAGDESTPRTGGRRLLLRVSDITTLVSVSLVVVKVIAGAFSAVALWAAGRYMLYGHGQSQASDTSRADSAVKRRRSVVSNMLRWKLPPWLLGRNFIISLTTFAILIQPFTGPLLTGSVDWNLGSTLLNVAIPISAVNPEANFGQWFWYNQQGAFDKRGFLRTALGNAGAAWSNPNTVDARGKSSSGNGCRHVVNNNGLTNGSVLVDATLPCIRIDSISWFRSLGEMPSDYWNPDKGRNLSLVEDDPFSYYGGGVAFVWNPGQLDRPGANTKVPPPATLFSGTLAVALLLGRHNISTPRCTGFTNTRFGNADALPYAKRVARVSDVHENCFLVGNITFTAGVTRSSRARYLSPRIVEDQTSLDTVKFEPSPWTREAIWWLPDMMTLLATTNVSQIPTFGNIDGHVEGLLRQAYLGAWDMLSRGFDEEGPTYSAYATETRLVASVRLPRVLAWMSLCLLMTAFGSLLLAVVLRKEDFEGKPDGDGEGTDVFEEVLNEAAG